MPGPRRAPGYRRTPAHRRAPGGRPRTRPRASNCTRPNPAASARPSGKPNPVASARPCLRPKASSCPRASLASVPVAPPSSWSARGSRAYARQTRRGSQAEPRGERQAEPIGRTSSSCRVNRLPTRTLNRAPNYRALEPGRQIQRQAHRAQIRRHPCPARCQPSARAGYYPFSPRARPVLASLKIGSNPQGCFRIPAADHLRTRRGQEDWAITRRIGALKKAARHLRVRPEAAVQNR